MKILLVEKNFELREIFSKMLNENLGDVDIDTESDGDEALTRYCRRGPYDLVITDDYHEGLDAVEFVKAIRKENPDQKIAALTLDKEMGQRLWREFKVPYLRKPFDRSQFRELLQELHITGGMTKEQLENSILRDVVTNFVNLKQSTPRRSLLIKYKNQPASTAIFELTNRNIIRRKNNNVATVDEEYLPSAAAFELCGDNRVREDAKNASTVVLTALQNMFIEEQRKEGFTFQDLKRHVEYVYPNRIFDDETLKRGLYLAKDLGAFMGYRVNQPDETEVEWFQVSESAVVPPESRPKK